MLEQKLKKMTRTFAVLFVLMSLLFPTLSVMAATNVAMPVTEEDRQQVLEAQKYLFWKQINEARRNPRAALARIGVSEEQARAALGLGAWILDKGLPPLAWSDQLNVSASAHGRDMINNLYYGYQSLDGRGPAERIAGTGYEALVEDETLGVLLFATYVDYELAVTILFDNMLRDELTGAAGARRNIFSPVLTDVGISFFAETLTLLADQPYAYLLVLDFAKPLQARPFLIGTIESGTKLATRDLCTGFWDYLPLLVENIFQLELPDGGVELVMVDAFYQTAARQIVEDNGSTTNRWIILEATDEED